MAKQSLVVVESAAKAKTIEKFLGRDYIVRACMGHVRDLPTSKLGVDVEHEFRPQYVVPKERKDVVKRLKDDARTHAGRGGLTRDLDLARARRLEPGDQPQQGALAAPRGAHQHQEGARLDVEIDWPERGYGAVTVGDVLNSNTAADVVVTA